MRAFLRPENCVSSIIVLRCDENYAMFKISLVVDQLSRDVCNEVNLTMTIHVVIYICNHFFANGSVEAVIKFGVLGLIRVMSIGLWIVIF